MGCSGAEEAEVEQEVMVDLKKGVVGQALYSVSWL